MLYAGIEVYPDYAHAPMLWLSSLEPKHVEVMQVLLINPTREEP